MTVDAIAVSSQKSTNVRASLVHRGVGMGLRLVDLLAPAAAARMAANLFLTPRKVKRPEREIAWCAAADRVDYHLGSRRIATWERGAGEVVLLVHGWEGRGAQLASFADDSHRFVAVDLPAHGESDARRTNVFECATVIGELIDRLQPRALIAHSFGCAATTIALRDRTGRVAGLRLVYVAPPEDFNFFTSSFGATLGIPQNLARRMQRELEVRFDTDWALVRGAAIAPAMTSPLLIVHDEHDREVPFRYGRALAAGWAGSRLIPTHGLGHRRILRDPAVVSAAREFIDSE